MYCTRCGAPLPDDSKFCTACGVPLTNVPQPEPVPIAEEAVPSNEQPPIPETQNEEADAGYAPHSPANQVWNTPDNNQENRTNTKHAFMALGVVAVLIIALIAALVLYVSSFTADFHGFDMDFDFDLTSILDDLLGSEPVREPAAEAVWALNPSAVTDVYADDEFLYDFEQMLLYSWYSNGDLYWIQEKEHMFLSQYVNYGWEDPKLAELARGYLEALQTMTGAQSYDQEEQYYLEDYATWLEGWNQKCRIIIEMSERYISLSDDETSIVDYYTGELSISTHELDAEKDLKAQLIDISAQWDANNEQYYITYTNNTECAMDVIVYSDYETESDYLWEEAGFYAEPCETITIVLEEMPHEFENWYIDWYVNTLYINGVDIYEYY